MFFKRNILICCFMLLSAGLMAQQGPVQPFKAFGYDDQSIYGLHGAGTFYFHISPEINFDSTYIRIRVLCSQVLDRKNSYLNFSVSEKPYLTIRLPEQTDTIDLVLRFSRAEVVSEYLKLKITTNIRITDNRCNDLTTDALWVRVLSSSYLYMPRDPSFSGQQKIYINRSLAKKTALVYHDGAAVQNYFSAAAVHSFMCRLQGKRLPLFTLDEASDTLDNFILLAGWEHLPENIRQRLDGLKLKAGQGLIYLDREQSDSLEYGQFPKLTERLIITGADEEGLAKAVHAFLAKDVLLSSFTQYAIVGRGAEPGRTFKQQVNPRLSLSDLGALPEVLEGIGSLSNTYMFRKSDFGMAVRSMELMIQAKYTPIGAQDRGFFNLFLNGHFLKSIRLDDKGKIEFKTEIDYHKLQKDNTLRVEFVFYPNGDDCKYSFLKFNCQVDVENTYLRVLEDFTTRHPNFFWFPEIFYDKPLNILVSKGLGADMVAPLSEIYTHLNYQSINKFDIYPRIYFTSELADSSIQAMLAEEHAITLLQSRDPLVSRFRHVPINYSWKFKNFRNMQLTPMFQLLYSDQVALAQIFNEKSDNVVLALITEGKGMAPTLCSLIRSFQKQSMPVKGNVIIGNGDDNYFFDVYEKNLEAGEGQGRNAFLDFWNEYSNYLLALMILLTLLFFLFVRQKSQKSKADF